LPFAFGLVAWALHSGRHLVRRVAIVLESVQLRSAGTKQPPMFATKSHRS
jgi:hypothetical protein